MYINYNYLFIIINKCMEQINNSMDTFFTTVIINTNVKYVTIIVMQQKTLT